MRSLIPALSLALAGVLAFGLAGCGTAPQASPERSAPSTRTASSSTPPASTVSLSTTPTVLRPVTWFETSSTPTAGSQRLAVTVNGVSDTVTVATSAGGSGRVTVVNPAGKVLLTVDHAAQAMLAVFGAVHVPVLVVRGDTTACGSGGCAYWTYTFAPQSNQVVAVPPPSVTAYRFASSGTGVVTTSIAEPGGLFGFVTPNDDGIEVASRLYDLYQHIETQEYAYAENGTAGGLWTAVGAVSYSPTSWEGVPFTSAATTVTGLLEARSLNLPLQADPLMAPGETDTVWNALKPLSLWGASLTPVSDAPTVSQSGTHTVVSEEIAGMSGTGKDAVLQAFQLSAVVSPRPGGSTFSVESVNLAPVAVPIDTPALALAAARKAVSEHVIPGALPMGNLTVFPVGLSWQIAKGGGPSGTLWVSVDALSGKVKAIGS